MSTYNRLDLRTLGSQPIMPKNLPDPRSQELPIVLEECIEGMYLGWRKAEPEDGVNV